MTLYRDRFDIITSILETAKDAGKTYRYSYNSIIKPYSIQTIFVAFACEWTNRIFSNGKNLQDNRKRTAFPRYFQQDEEYVIIQPTISFQYRLCKFKIAI